MTIGSFAVMLFSDLEGEIGGAFLGRYALIFFAGGPFTAWVRGQYPAVATLQEMGVGTEWLAGEQRAFTFFLIFLGLYNPATWFGLRLLRKGLGILAATAGVVTLIYSALAYGQAPWIGLGTILNLVAASLVLGASTTGLAVGHSYLSSPGLSPRPLRDITIVLTCALVIQILSLPVYLGMFGFPAAADRGRELLGAYGVILGARLAIGLVFPLVLAILAWHTTRLKAMRSATGLLYIGFALVLTGEIAARVLFFLAGLPV
jgi:hypothetical protein